MAAPARQLPDACLAKLEVAFSAACPTPATAWSHDFGSAHEHLFHVSVADDAVRDMCCRALSTSTLADKASVTLLSGQANFVYEVARPNCPSVVCRIFGGGSFGARGTFENVLVQELARHGLAPEMLHTLSADHCGVHFQLGRVEERLQGAPLASLLGEPNADLAKVCELLGGELGRLHSVLDQRSVYDGLVSLFPEPHEAVVSSRGTRWRDASAAAVKASSLRQHPVWGAMAQGFLELAAGWEQLLAATDEGLRCDLSQRLVLGHFDPTPGNVVVGGSALHPTSARLIDFEWTSPNVAVYDFAKFVVSVKMAMLQPQCAVTEAQLCEAVTSMARSYLLHTAAGPEVTADDAGARAAQFVDDIFRYVVVVAAVNVFSNMNHALEDGLLEEVPASEERRLANGKFNWLAHARNHLNVCLTALNQQ